MVNHPVTCDYCKKTFFRFARQINETKKFNWRQFCSKECHSLAKNKKKDLQCSNPQCKKVFRREVYRNTIEVYCSHSCAATVNNSKFPRKYTPWKNCLTCGKQFKGRKKYCSIPCRNKGQTISKENIIQEIKSFFRKTGRIPLKREFSSSKAAQKRFSTWNNAIIAAGFDPNPIMFGRKCVAHDGHPCDSLAEKIIDDWLYARNIKHIRSVTYPDNYRLTVDFIVENYWIEFFGLHGQHKRYDELRLKKINIAKINGIQLIELYPKDLFPKNKLDQILIFK